MPVDNEAEARYWARLRGKWAVHADQSPESLSKDEPEPQAWYPGDSETGTSGQCWLNNHRRAKVVRAS